MFQEELLIYHLAIAGIIKNNKDKYMQNKKEITRIYNVAKNNKNATPIKTDVEIIENAVIEQVIMYVRGYHNLERDKGLGSEHIKLHLEKESKGEISLEELLKLGQSIRNYIKIFNKPFIDNNGAKIYEWENNKNVRFRAIVDKQKGGPQLPLSPSTEQIITFYSDRNLKRMIFKNKEVEEYYKKLHKTKAHKQDKSNNKVRTNSWNYKK